MDRAETREKTIILLKEAIRFLYSQDKRNIDMGVNEMNICARLAHYLQNLLSKDSEFYDGYFVDTEYNRSFGGTKKRIQYNDKELHSVRCDLLIHSRGLKNPDNVLALEMKKEYVETNVENDHDRLENIVKPRMKDTPEDAVCDTILGVFIEIGSKECKLVYYWYDNQAFTKYEVLNVDSML